MKLAECARIDQLASTVQRPEVSLHSRAWLFTLTFCDPSWLGSTATQVLELRKKLAKTESSARRIPPRGASPDFGLTVCASW